ncbi:hypothetical protein GCM10009611_10420 [Arthrobacter roseus]
MYGAFIHGAHGGYERLSEDLTAEYALIGLAAPSPYENLFVRVRAVCITEVQQLKKRGRGIRIFICRHVMTLNVRGTTFQYVGSLCVVQHGSAVWDDGKYES